LSIKDRMAEVFSGLQEAPHGFKPSLTVFQELNLDTAKRDLRLEERAGSRAGDNEPALGSTAFDPVENEVVDLIESVKTRDRQSLSDQLEVYGDRLAALNFEGRLGDIDIGILEAKAEFKRIIQLGIDELHARRRLLLHREKDLEVFREDNNLRRAADYPRLHIKVFLIGLIFVLGFIETAGNTTFLAKGNELGIYGAYTEAFFISVLNLGGTMIFAHWCRNVVHVNIQRRFVGYIAVVGYLACMLSLNLVVAHYREVSGVFLENGGLEAIRRFKIDPFRLAEIESWLLFGMGCLFSIISFWDKLHLDDVYLGYGKRTRSLEEDREEYIAEKEHHTNVLSDHLSEAVEILRATKNDLMRWRQEHSSMLETRKRLIDSFDEQIDHLERSGNILLTVYREANRKARGGKAPKRFKDSWKMTRPHIDREFPATALDRDTMDRLIEKSEGKLEAGITALHDEHNIGLQKFRDLDDLVEDEQLSKAKNGEAA
jgi:hypothetical protein